MKDDPASIWNKAGKDKRFDLISIVAASMPEGRVMDQISTAALTESSWENLGEVYQNAVATHLESKTANIDSSVFKILNEEPSNEQMGKIHRAIADTIISH